MSIFVETRPNKLQIYLESVCHSCNAQTKASSVSSKEEKTSMQSTEHSFAHVLQKIRDFVSWRGVGLLISTPLEGQTPFQYIAERFPTPILKGVIKILEHEGELDYINNQLIIPLAYRNHACRFEDSQRNKAIHFAAKAGRVESVVLLAALYPDTLEIKNSDQKKPLALAPDRKKLEQALSVIPPLPLLSNQFSQIKPGQVGYPVALQLKPLLQDAE